MVSNRLKIYLTIFLILPVFCSLGQSSFEINRPALSFENECLHITYNLDDKNSNFYDVQIVIINASGIKINANALSGDLGLNIKAGKNKSIIWDISKDNIFLNESISVKIVVELGSKQYSKGTLILQSTIWPGWGQTKLKNGKPYWLIGCAGVACIAGSYLYNQESVSSYNQYINATNTQEGVQYYDQAIQQDNTSNIFAYSAIGIWAVNILWVALAPNESKYSKQKYSFGLSPIYNGDSFASVSFVMNVKLK